MANLQNWTEDTAPVAETPTEQGTEVDNVADTTETTPVVEENVETEQVVEDGSDKDAQKEQMRKNQLNNIENQARELEKETGLSLEDLLLAARSDEETTEVEPVGVSEPGEEFDKELFDKLVDARFNEKYGSKLEQLDKFGAYAAKIGAKEAVQSLPADYKDHEADITAFLQKNPDLAKTDEGVKTAYYAVKGMKSDEISQKAVDTKQKEINSKEEVKDIAFVENSKTEQATKSGFNPEDALNLTTDELAKLPKDIREQILRSFS
jgi:hypothetical protein